MSKSPARKPPAAIPTPDSSEVSFMAQLSVQLDDKTELCELLENRYNFEHQRGLQTELAKQKAEKKVARLESRVQELEARLAEFEAAEATSDPAPTVVPLMPTADLPPDPKEK
jgi:chromosome segregation ATPase